MSKGLRTNLLKKFYQQKVFSQSEHFQSYDQICLRYTGRWGGIYYA